MSVLQKYNTDNSDRIITYEDWQIRYWRTVIGCNTTELMRAIKAVGNSVEAVKNYLKNYTRS